MKGIYERKDILGEVADIDTTSKRVVMNWSAFGNIDYGNDTIVKGAYKKSISEKFAKGHIYWLKNHDASVDSIVGKLEAVWEDDHYLKAAGVPYDDNIFKMYEDGVLRQHSVGIVPIQKEVNKEGVRVLKELMLMEGSTVLWGMNPDTDTVSVGKSLLTLDDVQDEMNALIKAIRKGTYTDDFFPLLEVRLKQVQSFYADLVADSITTDEPTEKQVTQETDETDNKQLINSINKLNELFK